MGYGKGKDVLVSVIPLIHKGFLAQILVQNSVADLRRFYRRAGAAKEAGDKGLDIARRARSRITV